MELYINISPGPAGKRLFTMRDSIYAASNVLKCRASPPNLSAYLKGHVGNLVRGQKYS